VKAATFTLPMEELSKTGNIKRGPDILLQGTPFTYGTHHMP